MTKKSTLLFLLVFSSFVFAQSYDWNWKNPKPFGNTFYSGAIIPPSTMIGVGDAAIIIKSSDGGASGSNMYVDGNTGRTLYDLKVVGTDLYICGSGGILLKSTDIGTTWIPLTSGVTQTLYQIDFVDANVGYAVGAAGTVIKTTDAGTTWTLLTAPTALAIYAIDIVTADNIYIGCSRTGSSSTGYSKMLMKTTDGGATWLDVSVADMGTVRDVDFIDANHGWACVQNSGKVYYTTDGGTTWANSTTASLVVPNYVYFINSTTGFVTNNNDGQIFKTTDGGVTWVSNLVDSEPFYQVKAAGNTLIAFGKYGNVRLSNDLGTTWSSIITALTRETLKKVYFTNNIGYACGGSTTTADLSGFMLKSEDGGSSWAKLAYNFNFQVYSFCIQSSTVWYVGTGNNKLFKTTDGGATFFELTQPVTGTTHDFNAIEFADANIGYAAGLSGKIIKTTDAGATWTLLTFPSTSTINDIKVIDANTVIAAVGATSTYRTTDGGATWAAVDLGYTTGTIYDLEFYNSTFGMAAGYSSPSATLSVTTNGGATWAAVPSLATFTGVTNLRAAVIKDVNTWWLADLNGNIAYTKDAGVTWTQAKKILDHGLYSGALNNDKLFFVGSGGTILQGYADPEVPVELVSFSANVNQSTVILNWATATETNNRGFEIERKFNNGAWEVIGFVNGKGSTTNISVYSYSDLTSLSGKYSYRLKQLDYDGTYAFSDIVEVNIGLPIQFSLSQNYPNPFNPSTTISFTIPKSEFVTLKVFNMLGQEVKTLVNGFTEAGSYNKIFNASELSSGTYFYQLKTESFSDIKKMILVK